MANFTNGKATEGDWKIKIVSFLAERSMPVIIISLTTVPIIANVSL